MNTDYNWEKLYRVGGIAALIMVCIIPIQIVIFVVFPPPETVIDFFKLFDQNWIIGLLDLDFLYYINNILLALIYLGLFASMRTIDFATMLIAATLGLIGIATYFASTVGFEMLSLSKQYYSTDSIEVKQQLLASGHGLLAIYKGTAFNTYYILNAIALLLIAKTMFKSTTFSKSTATWGLIAGILMIIPSTAGVIGLIFSLASLVPWIVFSILIGKRLLLMASSNKNK